MANLAPGPCPRCDYPPEGLEKFRKPNGGVAWFCQGCTWVGDDQSIAEGRPETTKDASEPSKKTRGGKGGKGQAG